MKKHFPANQDETPDSLDPELMEAGPDPFRRGWLTCGCIAFVLFPLIYFLSYGPMTAIYYSTSSDVFDMLYEYAYLPISILWEYTPFDGLIDWYEDLWSAAHTVEPSSA